MSETPISKIVACQGVLIAALDMRDADAITAATAALADAIAGARAQDAWRDESGSKPSIDHALRQNDAARMRVNIMSEWTRSRAARLAELRGLASPHVYGRSQGA